MKVRIYELLEMFFKEDYKQFKKYFKNDTEFLCRSINYASDMLDDTCIHSLEPLDISNVEDDSCTSLSTIIDLANRTFVYEMWGHNGHWQVYEVKDLDEAKKVIDWDNMFVTSLVIIHDGSIFY